MTNDSIEIILPEMKHSIRGAPSWEEDYLIPVNREQRLFWPPFRVYFDLFTDVSTIHTRVVGDSAQAGDPFAGNYIRRGMRPWFRAHTELRVGTVLEARKHGDLLYSLRVFRA